MRVKRFNRQGMRKRIKLLVCAGKVFAKQGYSGTAIRDIAEVAKVQPSAFIYHFGNKENLFNETLRYNILEGSKFFNFFSGFDKLDASNPQAISDALLVCMRDIILAFMDESQKKMSNSGALIVRLLIDGNMEANDMVRKLGEEAMSKLCALIKQVNPSLSDNDINWWRSLFWALIFYPIIGNKMFLSKSGEQKYSKDFLNTMALRTTTVCCLRAGLPRPTGEETWKYSY